MLTRLKKDMLSESSLSMFSKGYKSDLYMQLIENIAESKDVAEAITAKLITKDQLEKHLNDSIVKNSFMFAEASRIAGGELASLDTVLFIEESAIASILNSLNKTSTATCRK